MKKMLVLFAVMLMALCLFGIAGFASGAPPGVANEALVNFIQNDTTGITGDIAGVMVPIASAVIAYDGGKPTEYMITSALTDHSNMDQASHVLGGCTCLTFAESSAVG